MTLNDEPQSLATVSRTPNSRHVVVQTQSDDVRSRALSVESDQQPVEAPTANRKRTASKGRGRLGSGHSENSRTVKDEEKAEAKAREHAKNLSLSRMCKVKAAVSAHIDAVMSLKVGLKRCC